MELVFGCRSKFNTPLHRIDTRVKIVSLISYILVASTLSSKFALLSGIFVMLTLVFAARTPLTFLGKRLLLVLPFGGVLIMLFPFITPGVTVVSIKLGFIALNATQEGLDKAVILFLRIFSAMAALTVLNATTGFRELVDGFKHLGVPKLLVYLLEVTVRYIFVLKDELDRMRLARKSRGYDFQKSALNFDALKTLSQLVAVLFIRSVERGERVFLAMLARGYTGEQHCCGYCKLKKLDLCWGTSLVVFVLALKFAEVGGTNWQVLLK